MKNQQITAEEFRQYAVSKIDQKFGPGFAEENPSLVVELMEASRKLRMMTLGNTAKDEESRGWTKGTTGQTRVS